jgi:RNA polymerase sigma factor (sigma-70 family)
VNGTGPPHFHFGAEQPLDAQPPTIVRTIEERNQLAEANLALAYGEARRWCKHYANCVASIGSVEDVESIALYELVRCAGKFDPSTGFKFSTYAVVCVRLRLCREAQRGGLIRLPARMTPEKREAVRGKLATCSLDTLMADTAWSPPAREAEDTGDTVDAEAMIRLLPERERYILRRRANGATLDVISGELGCSRQYVQQVEQQALKRIRRRFGIKTTGRGRFRESKRRA